MTPQPTISRLRPLLRVLSYLGLALSVVPAFLVFAKALPLDTYKSLLLAGTLLYVATAPWWINAEPDAP